MFEQRSPNPLTMPVARNVQMMHKVLGLPYGDKSTDSPPSLCHPYLFSPGLLDKVIQVKQGGVYPVKGLSAAL